MSELDKLEKYLKNNGYEYRRTDEDKAEHYKEIGTPDMSRHQIVVLDEDGGRLWDAICHYGSYGYEQGLLEVMGSALIGHGDVEGWLTAEEVIAKLEGGNE